MSWMDEFDEAKRNEKRKKPLMNTCASCGKVRTVGDEGKCAGCFVKDGENE